MRMSFKNLSFTIHHDYADAFGDALMAAGAISVNVDDAREGQDDERPIFGEPGASGGFWDNCKLTALFAKDAQCAGIYAQVCADFEISESAIEISDVADVDWVQQNKDQFQPLKITDKLWIVPTWHAAPDASAINIVLDPGAAFGTGSHPTTRLCLEWLSSVLDANIDAHLQPIVLDYGCGSGILAIAAKKLGAGKTHGVDIDAQAIPTAIYNAQQNQVEISFSLSEHRLHFKADIVVANILANPLKMLAPALAGHTKLGGKLALAGILDAQADDIIKIYAPYFAMKVWQSAEGWSCIAGVRHLSA